MNEQAPPDDRRRNTLLREAIAERQAKLRSRDIRIAVAIQILTTVILFAVGFAILRSESTQNNSAQRRQAADLVDGQRDGCQAANLTRAYVRIYAGALNAAPKTLGLPRVAGVEAANPILDCGRLPTKRVPLAPAQQNYFVDLVLDGVKPAVQRGRITFTP